MTRILALLCGLCLLAVACARRAPNLPSTLSLRLSGSDGRLHAIGDEVRRARFSVFVFYSESCPCLDVHEPRLAALHEAYASQGVTFRFVNSEVPSDARHDAEVARLRRYAFPLLTDPGARLAEALGAEFATHVVVVSSAGRIVYSGGIDSDRNHLHASAKLFLRDALDALLVGGKAPSGGEALGCALRLR